MVEEYYLQLGQDEGGHKPKVEDPANKGHEVQKDQKNLSKLSVHVSGVHKNRKVLALHNQRDECQTCHQYRNYLQEQHQWCK